MNIDDYFNALENTNCTFPVSEKNVYDNDLTYDKSIKLQSIKLSETLILKIVSINNSLNNILIPNDQNCFYIDDGSITYYFYSHPINYKFDLSDMFYQINFSGLGFGRCGCRKWGRWSCHNTRYDRDCVDMRAYFNRCNEYCDLTCGNYEASFYIKCGECGQPEDC